MGVASFPCTFELLREVLRLPHDTEILAITQTAFSEAEIIVRHPALEDPRPEVGVPPLVNPTFRTQDPVVFVDWGQTKAS